MLEAKGLLKDDKLIIRLEYGNDWELLPNLNNQIKWRVFVRFLDHVIRYILPFLFNAIIFKLPKEYVTEDKQVEEILTDEHDLNKPFEFTKAGQVEYPIPI